MILKTKFCFHPYLKILFLYTLIFVSSCKKEHDNTLPSNIPKLKSWYEVNSISFKSSHNIFSELEPNFKTSYNADKDGYTVTELEFSTPNKLLFSDGITNDAEKEKIKANTSVKLVLFDKINTEITGAYMVLIGNNINNQRNIHYKDYKNYSGSLLFYNLYGNFENGYKIKNGKIVNTFTKLSSSDHSLNEIKSKNGIGKVRPGEKLMLFDANGGCNIETIDTYGYQCVSIRDKPDIPTVCSFVLINSESYMTCEGGSGGDNNGGGYTGNENPGPNGGGGSGGESNGSNTIPADPIMPGQDHAAINPKDYIKCFENIPDAGASYKISVQVQEPFENSDWNYGKNGVGHTAITLTKTGSNGESITQTIGFYPADNKFVGPSKIVDNATNDPISFTIQMNFDLGANSERFDSILNYISNPPKIYELMGMNCTYFINEACKKGGIVLPSAWSNIAGFMDPLNVARVMTPAGLAQSLRTLKNNGDNRVKTNPGKAPLGKGSCK